MIQEIYDCLLTRAFFINNDDEEIIDSIDSKEAFVYLLERVSKVMQQEDFFLIKKEYQDKLSLVIQEFRFKYNDASINEDINYIIGRLNDYKSMSDNRKEYLINQFYKNEYAIRNLPKPYQLPCNIDKFMQFDFFTLTQLFFESEDTNDNGIEIVDLTEFVSFMNILLNKCNEAFQLDEFCDATITNLNRLLDVPNLPLFTLFYIKKTLKNVEKQEHGKYKIITI